MNFTRKELVKIYDEISLWPSMINLEVPLSVTVDFKITDDKNHFGWCELLDENWYEIELSRFQNKDDIDLYHTMLHEMIHLARLVEGDKHWFEHDMKFSALEEMAMSDMRRKFT